MVRFGRKLARLLAITATLLGCTAVVTPAGASGFDEYIRQRVQRPEMAQALTAWGRPVGTVLRDIYSMPPKERVRLAGELTRPAPAPLVWDSKSEAMYLVLVSLMRETRYSQHVIVFNGGRLPVLRRVPATE